MTKIPDFVHFHTSVASMVPLAATTILTVMVFLLCCLRFIMLFKISNALVTHLMILISFEVVLLWSFMAEIFVQQ